jgi:hypothetical protein
MAWGDDNSSPNHPASAQKLVAAQHLKSLAPWLILINAEMTLVTRVFALLRMLVKSGSSPALRSQPLVATAPLVRRDLEAPLLIFTLWSHDLLP